MPFCSMLKCNPGLNLLFRPRDGHPVRPGFITVFHNRTIGITHLRNKAHERKPAASALFCLLQRLLHTDLHLTTRLHQPEQPVCLPRDTRSCHPTFSGHGQLSLFRFFDYFRLVNTASRASLSLACLPPFSVIRCFRKIYLRLTAERRTTATSFPDPLHTKVRAHWIRWIDGLKTSAQAAIKSVFSTVPKAFTWT